MPRTVTDFQAIWCAVRTLQHCRRLHFVGSSLGLLSCSKKRYVAAGYACAWVGHLFFEHNKPATFQYPVYSFMGDWVMYKDMITGKIIL